MTSWKYGLWNNVYAIHLSENWKRRVVSWEWLVKEYSHHLASCSTATEGKMHGETTSIGSLQAQLINLRRLDYQSAIAEEIWRRHRRSPCFPPFLYSHSFHFLLSFLFSFCTLLLFLSNLYVANLLQVGDIQYHIIVPTSGGTI